MPIEAERLLPQALKGRPLLPLALSLAAGILACRLLSPAWPRTALAAAALLAAALLICILTRFTRWQPLLLCGFALGFFLCGAQMAALAAWPVEPGEYAEVSGRVVGVPLAEGEDGYRLRLRVEQVEGQDVLCADIWLRGEGQPPLAGSRLTAEGYCQKLRYYANPGAFDYREYLRQQGVAAVVSTLYHGWVRVDEPGPSLSVSALCQWLRDSFCRALSVYDEQEQILVKGVFLGDDSGLDQATRQAVALTGMAHVFAVSGLHVGYLVLLARALCGRGFRRRRLRFWLTAGLLLFYLGLCGWPASMLRASIMALALLAADLFMEEADPVSSLSAAALICLSLRPLWLFSAGFQLSFAAVWALIELGPLLCRLLRAEGRGLLSSLAYALAAVLGTAPLICHYFFYLPWWGWLLSPLVIIAAGAAVLLCLLSLPAALCWLPLGSFILQGAVWIIDALAAAARLLQGASRGGYTGYLGLPWLPLIYGLLLAAPLLARRCRRGGRALTAALLCSALVVPGLCAGSRGVDHASPLPHAIAQVTFLDVGQGDCTLVRTADGCTVLIDGGGLAAHPGYVGSQVLLPYLHSLGLRQIDLLINSHPDFDHTDGLLSVMEELPVGTVLYSGAAPAEENAALLQAAAAGGCPSRAAWAGDVYQLGSRAELRICSPSPERDYGDDNAASLVLLLELGGTELLLCGDAPGTELAELAEDNGLTCDLLLLPHHGSFSGYDEDFYAQTGAGVAVISVGAENSYGHPEAAVVEYWQEHGELYRTDEDGAITVYTDGRELAVTTEK